MNQQLIGLLDCNIFFVSCERLFRPDLIDKPVLVLSSNDGCVVARSQEVKDIGVLMGVPYFQIKDTIKKHRITTFSSHFALYRDISRRVFAVMRDMLCEVEQYSIDEAFFIVQGDPEKVALRLKEVVERVVGIPVSVGVARTKTQAKFANRLAKKSGGVKVFTKTDWSSVVDTIPLASIWGVGSKSELAFRQQGLVTVRDFLAVDVSRIEQLFGVVGLRLRCELEGEQALFFRPGAAPLQQSIMHTRSFRDAITDKIVIADALAYHVRQAAVDLRKMGQKARVIRVILTASRYGDYLMRGGTREIVLPVWTNDTVLLLQAASTVMESLFEENVSYKKTGIVLSDLVPESLEQVSLFEENAQEKMTSLMSIIDRLNQQKGDELVLLGSRLRKGKWDSRIDLRSPAYTTKWSDIALVKA